MKYQTSATLHVKVWNQGMVLLKDLEKDQGRGLPNLLQKNILRGQQVDVLKDSQRRLVNLAAQQAAI